MYLRKQGVFIQLDEAILPVISHARFIPLASTRTRLARISLALNSTVAPLSWPCLMTPVGPPGKSLLLLEFCQALERKRATGASDIPCFFWASTQRMMRMRSDESRSDSMAMSFPFCLDSPLDVTPHPHNTYSDDDKPCNPEGIEVSEDACHHEHESGPDQRALSKERPDVEFPTPHTDSFPATPDSGRLQSWLLPSRRSLLWSSDRTEQSFHLRSSSRPRGKQAASQ